MQIQNQIRAKVREVVAIAAEKYGFNIQYHELTIDFKNKGQAAAQAWRQRRSNTYGLTFSLESARLDMDEMLNDTIPHEVAHLVNFFDPSTGSNHDHGWRRVCIGLGGTGKRTHSQVLSKARYKAQYLYTLDSGKEHKVGPKVHKNIQQKGMTYTTRKTKELISKEHFTRVITPEEHKREHQKQVAAYAAKAGADAPTTATSHKRPKAKPARTTTPPKGRWTSKLSHCSCLFDPNASRSDNIKKFVDEAGCTAAGAATYYAKIKKARG
jgi:predicted SprT family Zn-dependent metalloprotease